MVRRVRSSDEVPAGERPGAQSVGDGPVAVPGGVFEVRAYPVVVVSSVSCSDAGVGVGGWILCFGSLSAGAMIAGFIRRECGSGSLTRRM